MSTSFPARAVLFTCAAVAILGGAAAAGYVLWWRPAALPEPGSPRYVEYVRAFQVGVAALDSGLRKELAFPKLSRAIELVPEEPAAWANRGLANLRENNIADAERDLKQAEKYASGSSEIEGLLGLLAKRQGRMPEAVAHFRKAVAFNPRDLGSQFALAQAISEEGGREGDAEYQLIMETLLQSHPNNLHLLVQRAVTAHRRKDDAALRETLATLERLSPQWSKDPSRDPAAKLAAVHKALKNAPRDVEHLLTQFSNVLKGEPGYQRGTALLKMSDDATMGTALQHFLRLAKPRPTPAPVDRELTFHIAPWTLGKVEPKVTEARWDTLHLLWRVAEADYRAVQDAAKGGGLTAPAARSIAPALLLANARHLRIADDAASHPFPGGAKETVPHADRVLVFDWDNDLRMDCLYAGAGGLRFWHARPDGLLADVTADTGLAAEILKGDYVAAWAADVEMDGDVDVILARRNGAPLLLRNNGDGTFKAMDIAAFAAVKGARAFAWADLDNDGAADAVFLDAAGKLHVFANQRSGQFVAWPVPDNLGAMLGVTAADVDDDGVFDIVALRDDGTLVRISDPDHRTSWQVAELARGIPAKDATVGAVSLFVEDLDNNGALDIVVAGPKEAHVLLADAQFQFQALSTPIPLRVFGVLDVDSDGRLDLVGLDSDGKIRVAGNTGKAAYHHQVLRPLGNPSEKGDRRINSYAIGGEVEIRAGLLVQKQRITRPMVHFGLGEQSEIDVVRMVWPSGYAQWEFQPFAGSLLLATQRLVGSCPFLFTFDGVGMRFAGDFMWATPLGMYVNGQNISSFDQTTEWLSIRGEHLVAKGGYYDVRVHANLWEADYFDQLALIVVDHPANTEIHVDERFFLTPTPPQMYVTTPARPVARAWDHHGQDATDLVQAIDARYLDRAGRGKFQGVTNDHWVEADLGDDAPTEGPVYLIARGWTHPTDSSINVAISQGKHDGPRPLVLEVPDGKGGWKVGRPALGFPAGKDKSMVIRLDGIDGPGVTRRFRLRTNMEIYWDFLGHARGLDSKLAKLQRPAPQTADLRYRGILEMTQKDTSSPELPVYDKVSRGVQPWRDLTGWYTRFGDVRELVAKVDDRYVIANAGDEIAFRFPAPADPPSGWKRDFIWECDGWTRDGNPNTRFGTTVLPLPAHGIKGLDQPPGNLEDDPVYRRFPEDWRNFHTRYITPDQFERGLRTFRRPAVR